MKLRYTLAATALTALVLYATLHRHVVPGITLISTYLLFASSPVPTLDPATLKLSSDISHTNSSSGSLVPKVIHQIKLGGSQFPMRDSWKLARSSCETLHPKEQGWQIKLWQDPEANEFVLKEYGVEIYDMYRAYSQEIMRTNVLRYMILHRVGGIYLDIDMKCEINLEIFLDQDFVTPPAQPTGVNNAFIVARPNHPFFEHLISNLPKYNLNWFGSPYITNMMSTGCHFFSTMHLTLPHREHRLKILPWEYRLAGHVKTPLFEHLGASSWHKSDAAMILQLGKAIELFKPYLDLVFGLVILSIVLSIYSLLRWRQRLTRAGFDSRPNENSVGYEKLNSSPRASADLNYLAEKGQHLA